mmetsp:Transcript_52372/g.131583  ORF Transcript_52372/g.131583 Transcript_52372/m.131583 type:complete len:220 (+) Transcript_52372:2062-2721(+)
MEPRQPMSSTFQMIPCQAEDWASVSSDCKSHMTFMEENGSSDNTSSGRGFFFFFSSSISRRWYSSEKSSGRLPTISCRRMDMANRSFSGMPLNIFSPSSGEAGCSFERRLSISGSVTAAELRRFTDLSDNASVYIFLRSAESPPGSVLQKRLRSLSLREATSSEVPPRMLLISVRRRNDDVFRLRVLVSFSSSSLSSPGDSTVLILALDVLRTPFPFVK